jgi:hypothetical protein
VSIELKYIFNQFIAGAPLLKIGHIGKYINKEAIFGLFVYGKANVS